MPLPDIPVGFSVETASCGNSANVSLALSQITTAFSDASAADQQAFLDAITSGGTTGLPTFLQLYEASSEPDILTFSVAAQGAACANGQMATALTVDPTTALSTFSTSCDAGGVTTWHLLLGGDVLGTEASVENLDYTNCEGGGNLLPTAVLVAPNGAGPPVSDSLWKQIVLDMLGSLLACCNPCAEPLRDTFGVSPGEDTFTVDYDVDHVEIELDTDYNVGWQTMPAGLFKYMGRFCWVDQDGYSFDMEFINANKQYFLVPEDGIQQFNVYLNPGVSGSLKVFPRESWVKPAIP